MKIQGFQKMTLLDFPNRVACTLFTAGCNMRCPFCHNSLLVTEIDQSFNIDQNEILGFLKKRIGLLDGVCITGGEPLLQPDIEDFIKSIKEIGYKVKLDTNGTSPEKLISLVEKNLVDYVAMDIKNSFEKYAETTGIPNIDLSGIKRSIDFLIHGNVDYEFRTTVVAQFHTVEDIRKIAVSLKGAKRYFLQNFEDSGNLIGENLSCVTKQTLEEMCRIAEKSGIPTSIRGL